MRRTGGGRDKGRKGGREGGRNGGKNGGREGGMEGRMEGVTLGDGALQRTEKAHSLHIVD